MITPYSITELAGAVAVVLGAVAGVMMAMFKSRCTEVSCGWGCWKCTRTLPADPEPQPADASEAV